MTSSSGAKQWSYSYEPFGSARNATKDDAAAPANRMRFAGEQLDTTTGLYHLRARQYDPASGRFLATDPLPHPTTDRLQHHDGHHPHRPEPAAALR